jgi:putative transposase
MVRHPHDYRWTSYHANADGRADPLITPHPEYLRLGRQQDVRRATYRELFKAHMEPETIEEIRLATNGNFALGAARFQKQIEAALGRRAERRLPGRKPANGEGPMGQGGLL